MSSIGDFFGGSGSSFFIPTNRIVYDSAGNYTYTTPYTGLYHIILVGGGGGGGYTDNGDGASGGAGGYFLSTYIHLIKDQDFTCVVGAGGNGENGYGSSSDGEATKFGDILICYGGKKGKTKSRDQAINDFNSITNSFSISLSNGGSAGESGGNAKIITCNNMILNKTFDIVSTDLLGLGGTTSDDNAGGGGGGFKFYGNNTTVNGGDSSKANGGEGYGAGGGGGYGGAGGAGAQGICIILESDPKLL